MTDVSREGIPLFRIHSDKAEKVFKVPPRNRDSKIIISKIFKEVYFK